MTVPVDPQLSASQGARLVPPETLQLAVDRAVLEAGQRIAPPWPLDHSVAVSPLAGVAGRSLPESAFMMARTLGARLTMPRRCYADLIENGRIRDEDISAAIDELTADAAVATSVRKVKAEVLQQDISPERFQLPTVASLAQRRSGVDWEHLIQGSISNWAADYFDKGVAVWSAAPRDADPWQAYQAVVSIDRSAELLGLKSARRHFASLPAQPTSLLVALVERLNIPGAGLTNYFHRLLADVSGWAAYARYRGWVSELRGEDGAAARQLLAVRAAWELVLLEALDDPYLANEVDACRHQYTNGESRQWCGAFATDHILQLALERATQRDIAAQIKASADTAEASVRRPETQAVFCTDVPSERLRRALEQSDFAGETLGFTDASFLPVSVQSCGRPTTNLGPVLQPAHNAVNGTPAAAAWRIAPVEKMRLTGRSAREQRGSVDAFADVESFGIGYLWKLLKGIACSATPRRTDGEACSIEASLSEKVALAHRMLRGMSLTRRFANLVVLTGHGSMSADNTSASVLHCGTGGGHAGNIDARLAASLLNDPFVRAALIDRGIHVPYETWFIAARHDSNTDQVFLLDVDKAPAMHAEAITNLRQAFDRACELMRAESASTPGMSEDFAASSRKFRGSGRSQVGPERSLAACSAFIAAPRGKTRGISNQGRCLLHDYQHTFDENHAMLEKIMTAPLIAAGCINLQHYGSTADNRHFGSDFIHEPLRLTAVIDAPQPAIDEIISRHDALAALVDTGWIQMHSLDADGDLWRRRGQDNWLRVNGAAEEQGDNRPEIEAA